jgi:phosphate-selective porin OprO/OprP
MQILSTRTEANSLWLVATFAMLLAPVGAHAEEPPSAYDIRLDSGGFSIQTTDGRFKFALGGRLQLDAAGFIEDVSRMGNGFELRRARIKVFGTVYDDWDYKLEVNFDPDLDVPVTDGWIKYSGFKPFTISLGHMKVPFSQQSMTSSNWQVFQERALQDAFIDTAEGGRRRLGLVIGSYGEKWNAHAGFFAEGLDFAGRANEDWGAAGRLVIAPITEKTRVLTFGGALYYRSFEGRNFTNATLLRYSARPGTHIAGTKMVDTGLITSASDFLLYNVEASVVLGPWHGQAEYVRSDVDRYGMDSLHFDGWYTQLGYFITGESRNYNAKSGKFLRPLPKGRLGAWEVAVRYARLDLESRDVLGGREGDLTVGLNWWANRSIMFRFNYNFAVTTPTTSETPLSPPTVGAAEDEKVHAFMGRAQIVF